MNAWQNEPTPLTDAAENKQTDGWDTMAHHARELERQLQYARLLLEDWWNIKHGIMRDEHDIIPARTRDFLAATKSDGSDEEN